MLRQSSLNQALTLSIQLAEQGRVAVAKPNTILNELAGLSTSLFQVELKEEKDLQEQFQILEQTNQGTLDNPSQHSLQQDAIVKDLSSMVLKHIDFAKNTVKPLVVDFAQAISEYRTQFKPKIASQQFNIEALYLPELLDDESFLDTLKPYQSKAVLRPDMPFVLQPKTSEELIQLVSTGIDRLDKLVLAWLSTQSETFLSNIYSSFFTKEKTGFGFDDLDRLNLFHRIDALLAIVLMARKLYDNVDEQSNLDLSTYRNACMQLRDYAGAALVKDLNSIALFNRSERLVMSVSMDRYTVSVNGSVYKSWLTTGGCPEILLGYVLSGDSASSKAAIDQKAKEYGSRWDSFCLFYNTSESNKALDYFKDFLKQQVALSMKELTEAEQAYLLKNAQHHSVIKQLNDDYINALKKNDMDSVYEIALVLVAKHRFHFTSAYCILNDIHEAAKVNPDIEVREAALVAVINYLSDYFKHQIQYTNA